ATALQHPCNKVQQPRNSAFFTPRNSATSPYRGGETVAPLYPPPALSLQRLRLRLRSPTLRADQHHPVLPSPWPPDAADNPPASPPNGAKPSPCRPCRDERPAPSLPCNKRQTRKPDHSTAITKGGEVGKRGVLCRR